MRKRNVWGKDKEEENGEEEREEECLRGGKAKRNVLGREAIPKRYEGRRKGNWKMKEGGEI